jgi:hypothetical protein
MKIKLIPVLAVCFAVGLATISETADAKKKKKKHKFASVETSEYSHPSGMGFPNGRPWQALDDELGQIKYKLYVIDENVEYVLMDTGHILGDTGDILDDTDAILLELDMIKNSLGEIDTDLGDLSEGIDGIADDVSMLKNTLELQVIVETAGADDLNDAPIMLLVQVIKNGQGVTGMPADAFSFANSFPAGLEAFYCGDISCFAEGEAGMYMLELTGDWAAALYAGTLSAAYTEMTEDGDIVSNGTTQVSYTIPEGVVPTP